MTCAKLCFESISDTKAQSRLLSLHAKMISQYIINNQKRMEYLHRTLIDQNQEEMSEMVGEFLGNSQVMLNLVSQLNHYFNYFSNYYESKQENYVLSEEIDFCLDGLTASKWEKEIEVFVTKGELPRKVYGDL